MVDQVEDQAVGRRGLVGPSLAEDQKPLRARGLEGRADGRELVASVQQLARPSYAATIIIWRLTLPFCCCSSASNDEAIGWIVLARFRS